MLSQKQKNTISSLSYQLYRSKKDRQPDYLCNVIKKYRHLEKIESADIDPLYEESIRTKLNEKRIQQIKRMQKYRKVSNPQPYIKRTWMSPLQVANQKNKQQIYSGWKKYTDPQTHNNKTTQQSPIEKARNIYNILNINKKMHLFGQFMYCDFQATNPNKNTPNNNTNNTLNNPNKQNLKYIQNSQLRIKQKKMDMMHKQYCKLMNSIKKTMVICNKDSNLYYHTAINRQINPLKQDPYYIKIIKQNDEELTQLLIDTLSISGNFTFSSYIEFYQIFVWQQASIQLQIQFVIKLLMGNTPTTQQISYYKLSHIIDFMCSKIYLSEHKQSLYGFNQVMKKLIFGSQFDRCRSNQHFMSRKMLVESLQANQECISIFINVFYSE